MFGSYDDNRQASGAPFGSPTDLPHSHVGRSTMQHGTNSVDGPSTMPPNHAAQTTYDVMQSDSQHTKRPAAGLHAPAGPAHPANLANAPIITAKSVTGRSLTLVIIIMSFFACLTVGAVYMMWQSSAAWLRNMSSEVTVQIEPQENKDVERTVRDVVAYLRLRPGIKSVTALDTAETAKLLEPWLGNTDALADLPIPRLIAIQIDSAAPPDLQQIGASLSRQFPNATLDDHRKWREQINTVTRSFFLGGIAILCFVVAATIAIIVSATGSAMAANKDIVEVLNFVGATDRFIAHEFEKHFLALGIKAGVVGALLAIGTFLMLPLVMQLLGGGDVTLHELNRLVGVGSLDLTGYLFLGAVVVIVAALCMITSRFGVKSILRDKT